MKVMLISEKTLKSDSLINDNVDPLYIVPAIEIAQEQGLQPILGTLLYTYILQLVSSGNIPADYKKLLDDYITPYLEYKVMSDIQIPLSYKFRNLGMNQNNSEHTYSPSLRDVQYLVEFYDNKAKFYAQRMYEFLRANSSKYPQFCQYQSCADMRPNKLSYKTNIVL